MSTPNPIIDVIKRDYVPGTGDPVRIGDEVGVIFQAWKLTEDGRQTDVLINVEESNMVDIVLSLDKNQVFLRMLFILNTIFYFLSIYSFLSTALHVGIVGMRLGGMRKILIPPEQMREETTPFIPAWADRSFGVAAAVTVRRVQRREALEEGRRNAEAQRRKAQADAAAKARAEQRAADAAAAAEKAEADARAQRERAEYEMLFGYTPTDYAALPNEAYGIYDEDDENNISNNDNNTDNNNNDSASNTKGTDNASTYSSKRRKMQNLSRTSAGNMASAAGTFLHPSILRVFAIAHRQQEIDAANASLAVLAARSRLELERTKLEIEKIKGERKKEAEKEGKEGKRKEKENEKEEKEQEKRSSEENEEKVEEKEKNMDENEEDDINMEEEEEDWKDRTAQNVQKILVCFTVSIL